MNASLAPHTPGVFINEVSSGLRLVQGVATACAAFFDPNLEGSPQLIRSYTEWQDLHDQESGEPSAFLDGPENSSWQSPVSVAGEPSYVGPAVKGWFENGGGPCYIVPASYLGVTEDDGAQGYIGSREDNTGMAALRSLEEITILIAPDLWQGGEDEAKLIAEAMVRHCSEMKTCMAVLHTAKGKSLDEAESSFELAADLKKHAAVYYPWIEVLPDKGSTPPGQPVTRITVPPVGHVAGAWARVDRARGVFKAPANEGLLGALALEKVLTDQEQSPLNEKGINCLRSFPGRGITVWGARTLDVGSVEWRYINVRRLCNFIQESIRVGTLWAVFEPNDDRLWAAIRGNVYSFLKTQWRAGALLGRTAGEAFYVVCDESNNTARNRAEGKVVCDVGIAAVRPGEFIHFNVAQILGDLEA